MAKKILNRAGFTIVELIMATAVFSVVLLLGLTGFVQIGRMFYKGVTIAQTRDVSTNILQTVTNDIRLANDVQVVNSTAICIGNHRYTANLGNMVIGNDGSPGNFGLKRETFAGQGECINTSATPSSTNSSPEMLQNKMRVVRFSVSNIGTNLYRVDYKVVYGEDGDINNPTTANAECKNASVSTQFCSTSEITTIVHRGLGDIN